MSFPQRKQAGGVGAIGVAATAGTISVGGSPAAAAAAAAAASGDENEEASDDDDEEEEKDEEENEEEEEEVDARDTAARRDAGGGAGGEEAGGDGCDCACASGGDETVTVSAAFEAPTGDAEARWAEATRSSSRILGGPMVANDAYAGCRDADGGSGWDSCCWGSGGGGCGGDGGGCDDGGGPCCEEGAAWTLRLACLAAVLRRHSLLGRRLFSLFTRRPPPDSMAYRRCGLCLN